MGTKEEDIERIEGGDTEDDDFGYVDLEAKAKEADAERATKEEKDEGDLDRHPQDKVEELRFKDGDDEWDKIQEGADLDDSGEGKKEDVEEKVDEKEEKKVEGKEEKTKEEEVDEKLKEDLITYLDKEGGGTKYIVKGREYDLRDLSPQEIKQRFSLAGRAHQVMEEGAEARKQIDERERIAREGAEHSREIMRRYDKVSGRETDNIPEALKPNDLDTDNEKALKEYALGLTNKMSTLEKGFDDQKVIGQERELQSQLGTLEKEFPVMSREQVIAVKAFYPDADIRTIAENSHMNQTSDATVKKVLEFRPDVVRGIKEEGVKEYLAKKQGKTGIPRRRSSSTVSSKSSEKTKTRTPRTFDEIEAREEEIIKGYEDSLRNSEE